MPDKIDFKKMLASYRAVAGRFDVVDVPDMQYLMIDGHGDPGGDVYAEAVHALYPLAYKLKFISKRELGRDYAVPPLESLWWANDMDLFTVRRDKSQWQWTAMIMTPEWLSREIFDAAVAQAGAKDRPGRLDDVRLEHFSEGRCVQTLHVGSFEDEAGVLAEMHDSFIPGLGLRMTGRHHEIYFSDPRRSAPERLRTILRQPVE